MPKEFCHPATLCSVDAALGRFPRFSTRRCRNFTQTLGQCLCGEIDGDTALGSYRRQTVAHDQGELTHRLVTVATGEVGRWQGFGPTSSIGPTHETCGEQRGGLCPTSRRVHSRKQGVFRINVDQNSMGFGHMNVYPPELAHNPVLGQWIVVPQSWTITPRT